MTCFESFFLLLSVVFKIKTFQHSCRETSCVDGAPSVSLDFIQWECYWIYLTGQRPAAHIKCGTEEIKRALGCRGSNRLQGCYTNCYTKDVLQVELKGKNPINWHIWAPFHLFLSFPTLHSRLHEMAASLLQLFSGKINKQSEDSTWAFSSDYWRKISGRLINNNSSP